MVPNTALGREDPGSRLHSATSQPCDFEPVDNLIARREGVPATVPFTVPLCELNEAIHVIVNVSVSVIINLPHFRNSARASEVPGSGLHVRKHCCF